MYKLLLSLFVLMISMSIMVTDAEARRFGGGKSFGQSRSFSNNGAYNASRMPPAAKPASGASRWLGPLAGLAAGGLLASLFMGNGLGSGILSWILIAAGLFIGWRLLSRFLSGNRINRHNSAFQTDQGRVVSDVPFNKSHLYDTSATPSAPSGFDETAFLRQAKTVFIRLQAAYDNKNLTDIREFTAPQVFAEVQMQLQERGDQSNQTDVITIDATLVDLDLQSNHMTASVRFTGLIREEQGASPENINEIWHFTKDTYSQNWLVAGIQQDAVH